MKYYRLKNSTDLKLIGKFPQSWEVKAIGDIQKDIITGDGFINFKFKLPEIILDKKAQPTSYISVVAFSKGFLALENSFAEFLKQYTGNIQTWDLEVYHKHHTLNTFCLFYLSKTSQKQTVNFEQSQFYLGKHGDRLFNAKVLEINNYDEYLQKVSMYRGGTYFIKPSKLVLDFSNCKEHLIRNINILYGSGYFVSEDLKRLIEQKGFTGLEFQEIKEYHKNIEAVFD